MVTTHPSADLVVLMIAVLVLQLLLTIQQVRCTPIFQVIVNHESRECMDMRWQDECSFCFIPAGWNSIGKSYYLNDEGCPEG